ncbi:hypothetical protein INT43_000287 [Umbelopsis isabellina]|uniref:Elongation factor P n=1 Tax=Mortierella isabellina TaxID=91625 RepID=A0A8H7Q303_MORIS|nr:hypothetical protein INT43_000287 [Umbelopsis isabellina]
MLKLAAARGRPFVLQSHKTAAIYHAHRDYKLAVGSIRKGQVVQHKDRPMKVINRDHVSTGRGGAVVKMDLQDILSGQKANERFKSSDSLEVLTLADETYQFLYSDAGKIHLLHGETYEEVELDESACDLGSKGISMLEDGMPIAVSFLTTPQAGTQPITFKLPAQYEYTVQSVIERAGQAAKGTVYKQATLTNGAKVQVPEFISEGEKIVVDINELKYVKRA